MGTEKSQMKCEQTISSELLIVPCLMLVYNIERDFSLLVHGFPCEREGL